MAYPLLQTRVFETDARRPQWRSKEMFCSACGARLARGAKFCSQCGVATDEPQPLEGDSLSGSEADTADPGSTDHGPSTSQKPPPQTTPGLKWLKFWNYFSLPVGGVFILLGVLAVLLEGDAEDAGTALLFGALAVLQLRVAYGLHHRRLWAWQWNWFLIGFSYVQMFMGPLLDSSNPVEAVIRVVFAAGVGWLLWMWPNRVYWRKRRHLFAH